MKVWNCFYYWNDKYRYESYDSIVVAESEERAKELSVAHRPGTMIHCWSAIEIPTNKEYVWS